MTLQIWEYKTCESKASYDKDGKKMWEAGELFWTLEIDGDVVRRDEGLEKLGAKGWELVAVQPLQVMDWGAESNSPAPYSVYPRSLYIFKRPL